MPKVSIILPVFNGENTIENTVKSLLQQSFSDFELIICIDGSKDRSEEIIKAFNDERIILVKNACNYGLGRTLNRLVSKSSSDSRYIAMAEQDDYYYPERLSLQYDFLEKNPDCSLVSGIAEHYDGNKVTSRFPGLLISGSNYPDNHKENFLLHYKYQVKVVNSCMMFRKSVHIDNGLYFSMHYPSISVDWSYILRFSLVSKIVGLHVPLVRLDRRADRQSLTTQNKKKFLAAREVIHSFYYEHKHLISKKDYKTALTTEHLLELSAMKFYRKLFFLLIFFSKNPIDKRWLPFLKKTFKL